MRTFHILAADFPGNENSILDDQSTLHPYPQISASVPVLEIAENTDTPVDLRQVLRGTTFLLHEDAEPTDVLSQDILPSPGLLVSPECAGVLQQYQIPPECFFCETTVEHHGQIYPYFWLHVSGLHSGAIDFDTTRFARFRPESPAQRGANWGRRLHQPREIPVHSEQELLGHLRELLSEHVIAEDEDIPGLEPEDEIEDERPWEELSEEEQQALEEKLAELALSTADTLEEDTIKQELYLDAVGHEIYTRKRLDYDLLVFPFPRPALFVSEELAERLEESGLTGYTLLPFQYCIYP